VTPATAAPAAAVLEYRTPQPARVNPRVVEGLIAAGAQIISVTCATRSLEDIYVDAVGPHALSSDGTVAPSDEDTAAVAAPGT
jgi:hypothetical protein